MLVALEKLGLMVLAAAVVYARAAKSTSSNHRLLLACLQCTTHEGCPVEDVELAAVLEDAFVGLVALVARIAISIWLLQELVDDGQPRVIVAQLLASGLSLVHWLVRYVVLKRGKQSPLLKLGGSSALVDASSSVMLAFARAPLLVSSVGRFNATARLITSLLLTMVALQRILFATACCGHLVNSARHLSCYRALVIAAAVQWITQAACLAVLLADVFATPLAFSATRSLPGDPTPLACAFFLAATAAAMPRLLRSVERLLDES